MFRAKIKRRIEELEKENSILKSESNAIKKMSDEVTEKYKSDMRNYEKQIAELKDQVEKLTRKRDKKGRFVKKDSFGRGDIVKITYGNFRSICILKSGFDPEKQTGTIAHVNEADDTYINSSIGCAYTKECFPATDEEKAFLFKKLEENGYRWNDKTKNIEK